MFCFVPVHSDLSIALKAVCLAVVPVDVIILMHAVELQLKAAEQVLDHDAQVVIEDPGAQTS